MSTSETEDRKEGIKGCWIIMMKGLTLVMTVLSFKASAIIPMPMARILFPP